MIMAELNYSNLNTRQMNIDILEYLIDVVIYLLDMSFI